VKREFFHNLKISKINEKCDNKMGHDSIKYKGKKFIVKEELGYVRLEINYMYIEDITELKGLDNLKHITALDLSNNKISGLNAYKIRDTVSI
jgi:hypothetical protein